MELFVFTRRFILPAFVLSIALGAMRSDLYQWEPQHYSDGMVFSKNAATTKGSAASFNKRSDVTFVVHLTGEMGNHLYYLAHGLGLVKMARAEYGIDAQLVLKQQSKGNRGRRVISKAIITEKQLKQCFPNLRPFDFGLGNSPEYMERVGQQENWTIANMTVLKGVDRGGEDLRSAMEHIQVLSRSPTRSSLPLDANLSLPLIDITIFFLTSTEKDTLIDKYFDEIREFLVFDENACCREVPRHNETVLVSLMSKPRPYYVALGCLPNVSSFDCDASSTIETFWMSLVRIIGTRLWDLRNSVPVKSPMSYLPT
jgi:hypothetical protein